jgi:crotonobetainyl-CoA:carnitine CoA-transferase CaiB-like acyl-CoA transferase
MEPPLPAETLPLEGLTVVEFSTSVAGPFAGHVLADLGARVIKVENPEGGDDARRWGPPFDATGTSPVFAAFNRNKRSITVDLKDDVQVARLRRFVIRRADIVLQNMRPGLLGRFGLDAATLRADAPHLIYCDMHAFGSVGPKRMQPGYDPLMQACSGIMSVTGLEGQEPVRVGPSLVDQGTGMWAVIGILAALRTRESAGEGSTVDTSLYETALSWLPAQMANYVHTQRPPRRIGSENSGIAPYKAYKAADGWLVIAAGNDKLFARLAKVLGRPDLAGQSEFATNPKRVENREALNTLISEILPVESRDTWLSRLAEAGIPAAPVLDLAEVSADPQFTAVEMLQSDSSGDVQLLGIPLRLNGERPPLRRTTPMLGEANDLLDEAEEEA